MRNVAVIPARNEAKSVGALIPRVLKYVDEVIVVDDGSIDSTSITAERAGAIVVKHAINLGKGAALKTGCDLAVRLKAKNIIVMDADGQHNPNDISKFIDKLKKFDVVIGYRNYGGAMPLIFQMGNRAIEMASLILFGLHVRDTQCGFRAFKASVYPRLRWKSSDYSVESEMIARISKKQLSMTQIQIETIYSDKYKGTTIIDGMKIVFNMIRWRVLKSL
ncbi:MAG: glycosyltransferase family 2 protein [Nanoarchaeota archaeon]